jgi:hypothetical protein
MMGSDCVEGDILNEKLFSFAISASFVGSMMGKSAKPTQNPGRMVLSVR